LRTERCAKKLGYADIFEGGVVRRGAGAYVEKLEMQKIV
jgi:hypothetical protein